MLNVLATVGAMVAAAEPAVHRWTRAEYDALIVAGGFENARVELLDGHIVDMAPTSNRHWYTVDATTQPAGKAARRVGLPGR